MYDHDDLEQPRKRLKIADSEDDKVPPRDDTNIADAPNDKEASAVGSGNDVAGLPDRQAEKEVECGITHFVNLTEPGFTGILKQRYTDFLVNEILPSGEVLHLKNLNAPSSHETESNTKAEQVPSEKPGTEAKAESQQLSKPDAASAAVDGVETSNDGGKGGEAVGVPVEDIELLQSIFGEQKTQSICSLHDKILKSSNKRPKDFKSISSESISDRVKRTSAHQAIRRIFSSRLQTSTEQDGSITVSMTPRQNNHASQRRNPGNRAKGKPGWDALGGEHVHFTLYKENKDTMEVIGVLGSFLKLGPKNLAFAGTKDRRAVSVQRVSAYRVDAETLQKAGKRLYGSKIGDYQYRQEGLELGQLAGNEFVITLRDCHFPGEEGLDHAQRLQLANETAKRATSAFQQNGFINYYGLQRFGSFATSTSKIGVKLLQGDFKGAVDHILEYSPVSLAAAQDSNSGTQALISSDDKNRALALHTWETTSSSTDALSHLPRRFSAEGSIIRHLGQVDKRTRQQLRKNDYRGALQAITRNLRLMYVHAYQSLVWNVVAGRRWESYGNRVVEGDLVLVGEHREKETTNDEAASQRKDEAEIDEQGEVIVRPSAGDSATAQDPFVRARALSLEEASSGQYTIFDIVLPLPGWDVLYPANAVGDFYKEFMGSETGGGLDPSDMRRSWKDLSLSGSYRKVLARPGPGLSYEIREYTNDLEQMVETDWDRLVANEKCDAGANTSAPAEEAQETIMEETAETQKKLAVVLRMQLGTSQYATVALREIMKAGGVREFQPGFGVGRS